MITHFLKKQLINCIGRQFKEKVIVIESDDWGSIRMPSASTYRSMLRKGLRVDYCPYCRYDSLASENDLALLFDVLTSVRDKNGHNPIITANCVLANPDFDKIEASRFREYHYEAFTRTLERYPEHRRCFALWRQGIAAKVFHPQFHGREHLNVKRWMAALQKGLPETRLAFDSRFFGISTNITTEDRPSYMAAFDLDRVEEVSKQEIVLKEGLELFNKLFGFSPRSFVAPNGILRLELEPFLASHGIRQIQTAFLAFHPRGQGKYRKIIRFQGRRTPFGIYYTIRNCQFEPSTDPSRNWVDSCLAHIETAFRWNKPAIINMHRVNVIGYIDAANRDKNLRLLSLLFKSVVRKWPEVQFVTSDQLCSLMEEDK